MSVSGKPGSRPPTVAVVGCGHWGKNIVRNFADLGALCAVADPDQQAAMALADKFSVPVRPLAEILGAPEIEAVAFASPAVLHAEHARAALNAGKHVFVEKPLALTVDDGRGLAHLARETGLTLMVGHLLRYHPVVTKLVELSNAGRFGAVKHLVSNRLSLGKVRTDEDVLWSFSPHDISVVLAIFDELPVRVTAESASVLGNERADFAAIHMKFTADRSASIFVSWLNPYKEQKFSLVGTAAHALFDDQAEWAKKLLVYDHTIAYESGKPVAVKSDPVAIDVPFAEPLREECQHFLNAIRTRMSPRTGAGEALRVLAVLDAATRSLALHGPAVPLPIA